MKLDVQIEEHLGAFRFTDADVRENPDLLATAVRFLQRYHGDWEPLRDARLMAVATGTLTVPVARMVLNCMRTNAGARWGEVVPIHEAPSLRLSAEGPEAQSLPPARQIEDWRDRKAQEYQDAGFVHNPDEPHWVNQARRNHGSVFTRFVPKMKFVVSGHPPAERRVWHLVNTDACRIEWRDGKVAFYHVVLWCKGANSHITFDANWKPGARSGGYTFAHLPDERKICATCPRIKEESKNR